MTRPSLPILVGPFVLAILASLASAQTAPSQTDTQNWNDVQLSVPLGKPVDFVLQGTLRNGRNITRPVDERIGIGFTFKIGKYLTVFPNYMHIDMQPFEGRRVFEERLAVATTVKFPVGKFLISDRNTFERRLRSPSVDATRYRNRVQVEHPIGSKEKQVSSFASDEVFYDWSVNDWVRNRFAVGVSKVVNKHFTLDLWYMRQNDGRSVPGDLNIIGSTWRFRM